MEKKEDTLGLWATGSLFFLLFVIHTFLTSCHCPWFSFFNFVIYQPQVYTKLTISLRSLWTLHPENWIGWQSFLGSVSWTSSKVVHTQNISQVLFFKSVTCAEGFPKTGFFFCFFILPWKIWSWRRCRNFWFAFLNWELLLCFLYLYPHMSLPICSH